DRQADVEAARRADGQINRLFLDPVFRACYPEDILSLYGADAPRQEPGDLDRVATPIDFLGVNYYTRNVIADDPEARPLRTRALRVQGAEYTEYDFEVYPEGLYRLLLRLERDYRPKAVYITENGAAFADRVEGGRVHDGRRVAYLREHFAAAWRAAQEGVPLRGYFVWSLLDNLEWHKGYSLRLGLVYVDYATQERILKDSAFFYRDVIAANAVTTPGDDGSPFSA
ncbi:MAG: family 1 glycosylhydrolase, partial [Anaerolineae bacterium]|nr:family 1 glycosylhydrolase [Anaerolineae bacterium]